MTVLIALHPSDDSGLQYVLRKRVKEFANIEDCVDATIQGFVKKIMKKDELKQLVASIST